jgi:ADP-heptose:LPS heptosyltransferase
MGIGDQLIASGLAREAWTRRGRKVAFGDGRRIIWDKHSEEIFRNNPNVCFPGNEARQKVEWIAFHKGHRGYNSQGDGRWIWNMDWRCVPGEIYFTHAELSAGRRKGTDFVVIEPNVVRWKGFAANKDWGFLNYQQVADRLREAGRRVFQFVPPDGAPVLAGVKAISTATFREAAAMLNHAAAYLGPEGGLHHAAAALGIPGVVIFGGFIPPSVTGYACHTNLVGSDVFCGSFKPCDHCRQAMATITVYTVHNAIRERLCG